MSQRLQQHQKPDLFGVFFPTLAGLACWMLERAPSHGDGPVGLVDDLH